MKNFTTPNASPKTRRQLRMLAAMWQWLTEPSASIDKEESRYQVRLLMAMLLVIIIFGLLVFILSLLGFLSIVGEQEIVGIVFRWINLAMILLLAVAYGLSRTIYFPLAVMLAIGTMLSGNFAIIILDPEKLQYINFLILGGLIGSLFLSARATAAIFFVTMVGLLLLSIFVVGTSSSNNIVGFVFILTVGGLVVLATALRQRYLEQLDWRTLQLVESGALLRELSILDALTGLYNRRYMEEILALEIIRAMRKGRPIGIIMVDIDHFKRFNDTHGHAAGDAVLVQVGNLLRTCVRASDPACRYGGEEFIFILPEASQKITKMRAEHMREVTSHTPVQYEGQTLEAVTLSLGVAIFPAHGSTKDIILRAADTALYRAKQDGRNRVVVAD